MATILPSAPSEGPKVTGLTATGVRVDGTLIEHAFMLTPTGLTEWDGKTLNPQLAHSVRVLPDSLVDGFYLARLVKQRSTQ